MVELLAVMVVFGPCPAFAARDGVAAEATISIRTDDSLLREGDRTRIALSRDSLAGDLQVLLKLGGDATPAADYTVTGGRIEDGGYVLILLPEGVASAELGLMVEDDTAAEAEESLRLDLKAGRGYRIHPAERAVNIAIGRNDFVVTNANDSGEGSLRQAILNANALAGPDVISFESSHGTFATPQTILLADDLPALTEEVTINGYLEGRLWTVNGVTVSGDKARRVFEVVEGAKAQIESIGVADGWASYGGGILNRGELVVKGVTFSDNFAEQRGGGLANLGGKLTVINSTFHGNRAGGHGGGLASSGGTVRVTNSTFSDNAAPSGGGLHSDDHLVLTNTILANSRDGADCVAGRFDGISTNNLIETNENCGLPISTADPRLAKPGHYNGPTQTIPLGGGSPAINLGDNASAVDQDGVPLRWDQRGNGDPRFVAGITDIGAFEVQAFPDFVVDTHEDSELRACTPSGPADCSLRGAITLANARDEPQVITFHPRVFNVPRQVVLGRPLPEITSALTVDARGSAGVTVAGAFAELRTAANGSLMLHDIKLEKDD